jgi:hypothetical protein
MVTDNGFQIPDSRFQIPDLKFRWPVTATLIVAGIIDASAFGAGLGDGATADTAVTDRWPPSICLESGIRNLKSVCTLGE